MFEKKIEYVTFRLDEPLRRALIEQSVQEGRTQSDVIRRALLVYLRSDGAGALHVDDSTAAAVNGDGDRVSQRPTVGAGSR